MLEVHEVNVQTFNGDDDSKNHFDFLRIGRFWLFFTQKIDKKVWLLYTALYLNSLYILLLT